MLYDGAIRFLERAQGFSKDDPAEFVRLINNNLLRAQDIIHELSHSLDLRQGGAIAENLRRLYDYLDHRLMESNLRKEPDGIHDVIKRVTILRDAWAAMLAGQTTEIGALAASSTIGFAIA
jgi:flagellar protein FliS